jgi:DNA-binding FrmR family transcriptional regulator
MAHTTRNKEKLLARARRIQGQVEALVKALAKEDDCSKILHLIAGSRGAMDGLMAEVLEGHIREHVADPHPKPGSDRARATDEVIDLIRSYLG